VFFRTVERLKRGYTYVEKSGDAEVRIFEEVSYAEINLMTVFRCRFIKYKTETYKRFKAISHKCIKFVKFFNMSLAEQSVVFVIKHFI
jgi:hypothetical protein